MTVKVGFGLGLGFRVKGYKEFRNGLRLGLGLGVYGGVEPSEASWLLSWQD